VENTFNALARVVPSHLMDHGLYGFAGLRATGAPVADGDIAFDEEPCAAPADGAGLAAVRFADLD
jgi:tRNA 2-thiocytidine biosynthesis protein TtcA